MSSQQSATVTKEESAFWNAVQNEGRYVVATFTKDGVPMMRLGRRKHAETASSIVTTWRSYPGGTSADIRILDLMSMSMDSVNDLLSRTPHHTEVESGRKMPRYK